jgi:uncharacterized protein (DUF433 family)
MPVTIGSNGRIDGIRVSIYDVYVYREAGWGVERIMEILPLTREQVEAAIRHIEEHRAEVEAVHRRIEERNARGNPPEIEAKLKESRRKMEAWLQARRARTAEVNGEGHPGGRE